METPVELVALNCIRCGHPIPAEIDEVAWICEQCEQGQQLGKNGLLPLEIHYAQEIKPNQKGKPYWVCEGRVTLQRDTYGRAQSDKEARQFWSQPRRFVIPAFLYPVDEFADDGIYWLRNPKNLRSGPVSQFESVTVSVDDVRIWAEFLVMALEAARKDKVKTIQFQLELAEPRLWVLPPGRDFLRG
jgi:hypothetical protein